jgi:hypothetical protein
VKTAPGSLIGQTDICRRLGISIQTWRNWRARGIAPEPIRGLSPRRPRWRRADIDAFEAGKPVARHAAPGAPRRFFQSAVHRRAS